MEHILIKRIFNDKFIKKKLLRTVYVIADVHVTQTKSFENLGGSNFTLNGLESPLKIQYSALSVMCIIVKCTRLYITRLILSFYALNSVFVGQIRYSIVNQAVCDSSSSNVRNSVYCADLSAHHRFIWSTNFINHFIDRLTD